MGYLAAVVAPQLGFRVIAGASQVWMVSNGTLSVVGFIVILVIIAAVSSLITTIPISGHRPAS
ncbi:uncharacterized protein BJ212DRAFT_1344859 [Suillus subaureus]|uniref:Uncharacterized protein n=1 Tax=Suillus subaureus TaxID=48587 RepID=A0A9P7JFE2_9AGAM|nr:uncharacterized protein BJ212DRAFT_1344859 [Suillus subaureus]KAG1819228.1 hypothetical protein BJ212DRAFT_1344859 [Suillus subaureus]